MKSGFRLLLFNNFSGDVSKTFIAIALNDLNSSAILSEPSIVLNKLMAEASNLFVYLWHSLLHFLASFSLSAFLPQRQPRL